MQAKGQKKKFILILSGGFGNGGFQVGALKYIHRHGLGIDGERFFPDHFDAVFGISVGSYNGVMTAMGKHEQLYRIWDEIAGNPEEIFFSQFLKLEGEKINLDTERLIKYLTEDLRLVQKLGLAFKKSRERILDKMADKFNTLKSLASPLPVWHKLQKHVSLGDIKSDAFHAGYVSLTDGSYYNPIHTDYESDTELRQTVMASGSIPVVFPPVNDIRTKNFTVSNAVDGAIRNITPLGDAIKFIEYQKEDSNYYFVIISRHTGKEEVVSKEINLVGIAFRSLYDIALNEILQNDIKRFTEINSLVKQADAKGVLLIGKNRRPLKHYQINVIKPERELGASYNFSRKRILDTISHGYKTAEKIDMLMTWQ